MSDHTASIYKHEPLNLNGQCLRLLKIHYSEQTEPPMISLQTFSLEEDVPEFKAVSYTWGPSDPSFGVYVDGRVLSVRKNLYHFLRRARRDALFCLTTWLWIDQLCIDQTSVEEKNHQVNQMSMIFQQAHEVIVWLGRGTDSSAYFMDIIQHWSTDPNNPTRAALSPSLVPSMLRDAHALSKLDYWQRLWIRQEIILAQKLIVYLGVSEVSWEQLYIFSEDIASGDFHILCGAHEDALQQRLKSLNNARLGRQRDYYMGMRWEAALEMSRNCLCEDVRDRAYGMLGLVRGDLEIKADYSLPASDLCFLIISTWISSDDRWPEEDELKGYARLAVLCRRTFEVDHITDDELRDHVHASVLSRWHELRPFDVADSTEHIRAQQELQSLVEDLRFATRH